MKAVKAIILGILALIQGFGGLQAFLIMLFSSCFAVEYHRVY